jgi:hypothetical protein
MRAFTLALAVALVPSGCSKEAAPGASASVTPSASPSTAPLGSASGASASASAAGSAQPEGPRASGVAIVDAAKLRRLSFEGGLWVAELERTPPARAWVTLATQSQPLAPRARAAHFRIAERVAPGVVAPTALRALSVAELSQAADGPTRKQLEKLARVLANGTVEVALTLAPAPTLTRVELGDVGEDKPARAWETSLGAREPIAEGQRVGLAQYQALLVIDYVTANGARVSVFRHDKTGRITAAEGNEAFSAVPKEGTQHDALTRLSRHMTYSKSLEERLSKLERAELEGALGWGEPASLLITPKQLDECIDRVRSVRRLMAERVKQRGAEKALGLP